MVMARPMFAYITSRTVFLGCIIQSFLRRERPRGRKLRRGKLSAQFAAPAFFTWRYIHALFFVEGERGENLVSYFFFSSATWSYFALGAAYSGGLEGKCNGNRSFAFFRSVGKIEDFGFEMNICQSMLTV